MEKSHQTHSDKNSIKNNGLIIDLSKQVFYSSILDNRLHKVKHYNFFGDTKWPENELVTNHQKQIEEIVSKLIKNNESFKMFTNDYLHCFISNKVYEDLKNDQSVDIHNETWNANQEFNIPDNDTTEKMNKIKQPKMVQFIELLSL